MPSPHDPVDVPYDPGDGYCTAAAATHLRIHPDGLGNWLVDAADDHGNYTEACWDSAIDESGTWASIADLDTARAVAQHFAMSEVPHLIGTEPVIFADSGDPDEPDGSTGTTSDSPDQPDQPQPRDTEGRYTMSTPTTFPTTQTRTVETPVSLFVRPSKRNDDTIVVGVEAGGQRKRAVLVRVLDDGTVRVRTLDGNPREASSNAETQTVLSLPLDTLTEDPA